MEEILYKARVGSHLYGLNTEDSDEDFVGVFMPDPYQLLGLNPKDELDKSTKSSSTSRRNTNEDTDYKLYSLKKFVSLALKNNPNIVELLFVNDNNLLVDSEVMRELRANYDKLVSQKVHHSFTGYAYSQKKKLTVKAERYNSLVEAEEYTRNLLEKTNMKYLDSTTAKILNESVKYYKGKKQNCESFHTGMELETVHKKLKDELDNYGWRVNTNTFMTLGYDVKFGYHLVRLMAEGYELLSTGKLEFPVTGEAREDVMAVRNGEASLDELYDLYGKWKEKCDTAFRNTNLPKEPDYGWADDYLVRNHLYFLNIKKMDHKVLLRYL
jgi:predicted nucleotidyltransferase